MNNNNYASKINNIMDKAKEDVRTQLNKAYKSGYEDAKYIFTELGHNAINLAHEESDKAYQQGLDDAWEAARKIALGEGLPMRELVQIFGTASFSRILKENTASEAIAKIKEYEKQQKQATEIKVGDEVYELDENNPRVVTRIYNVGDEVNVVQITGDGKWSLNDVKELHRTGRTFPQIAEVLAEMRGEE